MADLSGAKVMKAVEAGMKHLKVNSPSELSAADVFEHNGRIVVRMSGVQMGQMVVVDVASAKVLPN